MAATTGVFQSLRNAFSYFFSSSSAVQQSEEKYPEIVTVINPLTRSHKKFSSSFKKLSDVRAKYPQLYEVMRQVSPSTRIHGEIIHLNLSGNPKITPEEFSAILQQNPNIETLNIKNCYFLTDDSFREISKLQKLKYLNASNCTGVSSAGLALILTEQLEGLDLSTCSIDDAFAEQLNLAPNLTFLNLSYPQYNKSPYTLSEKGILSICQNLTKLTFLDLNNRYSCGMKCLLPIQNLTELESLNVSSYGYSDFYHHPREEGSEELLKALGTLKKLKSLFLKGLSISDASIQGLENTQLEVLNLQAGGSGCVNYYNYLPVTLKVFIFNVGNLSGPWELYYEKLSRFQQLEALLTDVLPLDGELINTYWSSMNRLRKLSCGSSVNSGIKTIATLNPHLEEFAMAAYQKMDDSELQGLALMSRLKKLSIDPGNFLISDNFLSEIANQGILLEEFSYSLSITEVGAQALMSFSKSLKKLSVNIRSLEPSVAYDCLRSLVHLQSLQIAGKSLEGIESFLRPLISLRELLVQMMTFQEALFQEIGRLGHLSTLFLQSGKNAENAFFEHLSTTPLVQLSLIYLGASVNDGVVPYLAQITSLTELYTDFLTQSALQQLNQDLPLQYSYGVPNTV